MKNYYLLLLVLFLYAPFTNAQTCPLELGNDTSTELIHFIIESDKCHEYPATLVAEGSTFEKKSCSGVDLKYELSIGSPLPDALTFTADFGSTSCEYLGGVLRSELETLSTGTSVLEDNKVYPNPLVNGQDVHIQFAQSVSADITVYDLTGKQVMTSVIDGQSKITLDVSGLNNGVYLLNIASDNVSATRKIIVMR